MRFFKWIASLFKPKSKAFKVEMPKPKQSTNKRNRRITGDVVQRKDKQRQREIIDKGKHIAKPTAVILPLKPIRPAGKFYSSNRFRRATGLKPIRFTDGKQI
jgi:hypothetical protein